MSFKRQVPVIVFSCLPLLIATQMPAADCNGNGIDDLLDISHQLDFHSTPRYPAEGDLSSLVSEDLNEDGQPDVGALSSSGVVNIFLNGGEGKFLKAATYPAPGVRSLISAELNADGKPDLAGMNFKGISILMNKGDGSFTDAVTIPTLNENVPLYLGAADVDDDGDVDFVTSEGVDGDDIGFIAIYTNRGDGTFEIPVNYPTGFSSESKDVQIADFNGDGKPDVAKMFVDFLSGPPFNGIITVLVNAGDGRLLSTESFLVPLDSPTILNAEDLNGDGKPDLVTVSDRKVSVLINHGDGKFRAAIGYDHPMPEVVLAPFLLTVDLTGDGYPEITTNVGVFINNGDGTFQEVLNHDLFGSAPAIAADFNRDNLVDIAWSASSDVWVLIGTGDGKFRPAVGYSPGSPMESMASADLNGDGVSDIVTANREGLGISILLGNGDGTFAALQSYEIAVSMQFLLPLDANSDCQLDLIGIDNGCLGCDPLRPGSVTTLINLGTERFSVEKGIPPDWTTALSSADFNKDDRQDLVIVVERLSAVALCLNPGGGIFSEAAWYNVGAGPQAVTIGDFDGDGTPDLATANQESKDISVLLNRGDGTLQDAIQYSAGERLYSIAASDLNRDGASDIVARSKTSFVFVFINDGHGSFSRGVRYEGGNLIGSMVVKDLNGDLDPDLAVATNCSSCPLISKGISILLNKGDGSFEDPVNFAPQISMESFLAGDFNGDGFVDLGGTSFGALHVLLGRGNGDFRDPLDSRVDCNPRLVSATDLTRDGVLDFVMTCGSYLLVSRGKGDGTFSDALRFPLGSTIGALVSGDFNKDGWTDVAAARQSGINILFNLGASSPDANSNSEPDECESFVRGDSNRDGAVDISDVLGILFSLFAGRDLSCRSAGDSNDDGGVDISDSIFLLNYLFKSGEPPRRPFPSCGVDPTADSLACLILTGCP